MIKEICFSAAVQLSPSLNSPTTPLYNTGSILIIQQTDRESSEKIESIVLVTTSPSSMYTFSVNLLMVLGYTLYLFLVPWIGFIPHWICAVIDKSRLSCFPVSSPQLKGKIRNTLLNIPRAFVNPSRFIFISPEGE